MRAIYGYLLIVFLGVVGIVQSCGPSPCSWRTCRYEYRNDWRPGISPGTERCLGQYRHGHAVYTTHNGKGSCPASQSCSSSYQLRTKCSCRNAYYCPFYSWNTWSGHVPQGSCALQSRQRNYNEHIRYDIRDNNCNGIRRTCGSRQYDYRSWCSCRYADCELQLWTSWSDLSSPASSDHCASQERRKRYKLTWKVIERSENCHGHGLPTSCPGDVVETKEKEIYCPALIRPSNGRWNRDDCISSQQTCKSICQLICDVRGGYKLEGSDDKRNCLASGQWSQPWNSYCKDVAPPSITCPESLTVSNDANKASAQVKLPQPTASDNSGQTPRVVNSLGAAASEFSISGSPHTVKFTATDVAGNSKSCEILVTVKDTERPRVVTCPSEQHIKTNQNKLRVKWTTPVFQDNYDPQPVISSNTNPGATFFWGVYPIVYTASDRAGNNATCQFNVKVGPIPCPYYDAPKHGVRTCNNQTTSANGVKYEMVCSVQCRKNYAFASPPANTYLCTSSGVWNKVVGIPIQLPKNQKPWPDCAPEEGSSAAKKTFMFYTGKCKDGDDQAALNQIQKNFLVAVKNSAFANMVLCSQSNNEDCVVENVKVYCGTNSKRGMGSHPQRVIQFDFIMSHKNPSTDRKKESSKILKMMNDLKTLTSFLKKNFPTAANMSNMRISDENSTTSCPLGKVLIIRSGAGSELERSMCVSCPVGTHYNRDKGTCAVCQNGTYQDQEGQMMCRKCPLGKWTEVERATSYEECKDICNSGEYSVSSSGLATCLGCPLGSYQPSTRSISCIACPKGKTTPKLGSTRLEDCV